MSSFSFTNTQTFTATHAKYLASKVAADLKRIQRFYSNPSDLTIEKYELELIELLKKGYLNHVTYGFKRDGQWIVPTLRYTAKDLVDSNSTDDDPGKIRPGADVSGAFFTSFLSYNSAWDKLTAYEQSEFEKGLPIQRSSGSAPGAVGYFSGDNSYASGGRGIDRSSLKNL